MAARGLELQRMLDRIRAQRDATAVARTPDPRATQADADRASATVSADSAALSHEMDDAERDPTRNDDLLDDPGVHYRGMNLVGAIARRDSTARDAANRSKDLAAMMRAAHLTNAPMPRAVGKAAAMLRGHGR